MSHGEIGRHMCEGEYESLKAIHDVASSFVPKPYVWGKYKQDEPETYFLLTEFRDVGAQVCLSFLMPLKNFGARYCEFSVLLTLSFSKPLSRGQFRHYWRHDTIGLIGFCSRLLT